MRSYVRAKLGSTRIKQHLKIGCVGSVVHAASAPVITRNVSVVGIRRKPIFAVSGINLESQHHLPAIVHAFDSLGFSFGLAQCRQQHTSQDGNDRNNNKQFDQGEAVRELFEGIGFG